jgi:hypothetical protein
MNDMYAQINAEYRNAWGELEAIRGAYEQYLRICKDLYDTYERAMRATTEA